MAHKVKVKSEDFDQGDDSYKSKASSPTTPKRMTRSSSKRPANVAKLSDRSPNLHKKHKTAVKSAPVQDEKNESDEGDSTGEYTEGTEEDENGSHNRGTDDDDEKLVEKQLASVQKEQRQKAEMKKNELHLKQREENRRREQERFKRLAKHRKEKEQLKELEENNRLEQERLQLLEKQRKEKEAQEKKRLEEEQHRMKKVRQQQERIDMYNRVKERIDRERLEKEQKEAKEQHNRQLAEEQKAQKKDAAGKSLRQEEEDDDDEESGDEESDDEESGDEDSDEDSGDEDDGDEEDGDKYEEEEDEEDDDKSEEEEEDEDKDEQEDKNLVGANAPNPANPGNEELCACIRCIKSLAIGPLYSCDFTNNPDKCAQCTNRGRSCNPVSLTFPYPFRIATNIVRSLLLSMEPRADYWVSKNSMTLPTRSSVKHSANVYRLRPPRLTNRSASKDLVAGRPKRTLIAPSCLGKSVSSITRRKS